MIGTYACVRSCKTIRIPPEVIFHLVCLYRCRRSKQVHNDSKPWDKIRYVTRNNSPKCPKPKQGNWVVWFKWNNPFVECANCIVCLLFGRLSRIEEVACLVWINNPYIVVSTTCYVFSSWKFTWFVCCMFVVLNGSFVTCDEVFVFERPATMRGNNYLAYWLNKLVTRKGKRDWQEFMQTRFLNIKKVYGTKWDTHS